MTHTEESLMALATQYAVFYAAGKQGGWNELSVAIREVLEERDELGAEVDRADYATRRAVERAEKAEAALALANDGLVHINRERAVAEAERDELRKDAERYRYSKTLEGQVLYIQIIRNKGTDFLDEVFDDAMKGKP